MPAPAGASRSAVTFKVFSITLVGEARQQGRDHADLADAIGRDPHQRRCRVARAIDRVVARRSATANGMILTVAIISPATTGL